ncbi:NDP-glucose--starch glucosyltransferase [Sarracenia purpurea var. burkii]
MASFKSCRCDKPVKGKKIKRMKAGILESDRVLTVSLYYAQELVFGADKGVKLDNILCKTGIAGIVNGMDVQEWDPSQDKYIGVKYDATTVRFFKSSSPIVSIDLFIFWWLKAIAC